MRPAVAIHQEDELHALERAVVEACAGVDRSVATLMKALYEFNEKDAHLRLGYSAFSNWAESDRFPYDRSTAHQLRKVYETFVVDGGQRAEVVARAGWTKLHRLETLVAHKVMTPADAVKMAASSTQKEISDSARIMRVEKQIGLGSNAPTARLFDVRIRIYGDELVLHRRLRARDSKRAVEKTRQSFGKADLFGVQFGEGTVAVIEE